MRCSGGVVEWAAPFIQLPLSIAPDDPFNNSQINHILTIMHIFLTQTAKDEEFISNKNTELRNDSNPWMVVDSDGEIEGDTNQNFFLLKENELVSILNQIPFEYLFKAILYYPRSRVVSGFLTANYMLKLLSFSTDFIKILFNGLKLYSLGRYKQFTKRLGRLISHTVHYVTEILMKYKSQNIPQNEILRIQAEYDNFFFKSTKFIYSAKKHGSWQFLASLPYHMASANAIFKVYAILQLNDSQDDGVVNINFSYFEEKFVQLPEEEQCYLLTTLTNMVLAREVTEITFIKNVLLQLFFIGFISSQTMDQSYKSVKNLLHSICLSHSSLISEVLGMQNDAFLSNSIQDEKPSIHLWLNLPLQMWKPHKADLEILFEWLLEPSQNLPYELAKIILQSLNYGIKQGELFMEPETHREIAIMLMKASSKLLSENDQGYIKNLSNLVRPQNSEQTVCDWIWAVLLKLRLHLLDKTEASLYNYFNNLEVHLQCIPEAEADIDLYQLLLKKHSIAYFVALMTTTLGHSVPIICNRGFEFVEVLFSEGKYDHGIACLEFMTLLFLECGDSLYTSEKFISLLNQLIVADKTYVQMAKQLISNNTPGLVLKSAECMIQNQLNCCRALHFEKFSECVKLWIISLTKVPFWNQEFGALYLLDRLLQNAFLNYTATEVIKSILHTVIKEAKPSIETKSSFSPLVGWMQSKSSTISLLPKGFNGDVPWLSYFVIHMEFECFEKENCLWIELLKELIASSNKKTDVDNSLKKVCNHLGIPVRSSNTLAIYKWSYQILNTDISHPLIPLLWQSFFSLYFFKVPGTTDRGSAGVKFFDGVLNQRLFKQLTQKLTETCDHFNSLSKQVEEGKEGNRFWKLQELFQTYSLWMIDSRLHESNFLLYTLPPKYNIELLRLLFQGQNNPWTHFIEYENIEQNFKDCSLNWSKIKHRFQIEKIKTNSFKTEKSIEEKINKRFNTYETPLPAPVIKLKNYSFSRISPDVVIRSENMINYVEPLMNNLSQYGEDYTLLVNVNSSLCRDMQDLFPRLFVTSETQKILSRNCDGTIKTLYNSTLECPCSGPAIVTFKYEESKLNEAVFLQLTKCQKSFDENIEKSMSSFPSHLSTSIFEIDIAIEELKTEYHLANSRKDTNEVINKLKKTGVNLLYEFIKKWSVNVAHVPFLVRACDGYIDALGKTFLENNPEEVDRVLQIILNKEIYGEKLIKFFSPNLSSNEDFIKQYSCALESNSPRFLVLTKFDLERFLHEKEPKFSIRSSLISSICRGLTLRSCESDKSEENHQILRVSYAKSFRSKKKKNLISFE